MKSRADQIKSQLDEVAGDPRATWRRAQSLLHTNHKVVYNDAECATVVSTFSHFFVDKVDRIRDNIATALQSMERRVCWQTKFQRVTVIVSAGLYRGGASSAVNHATQVVATGRSALFAAEVMRRRLCPSHRQTCQSVNADLTVSFQVQASTGVTTVEEIWYRQLAARKLQADLQSFDYRKSTGAACTDTPAPACVVQIHSVPVRIQEGTFHRNRAARGVGWRLHCC